MVTCPYLKGSKPDGLNANNKGRLDCVRCWESKLTNTISVQQLLNKIVEVITRYQYWVIRESKKVDVRYFGISDGIIRVGINGLAGQLNDMVLGRIAIEVSPNIDIRTDVEHIANTPDNTCENTRGVSKPLGLVKRGDIVAPSEGIAKFGFDLYSAIKFYDNISRGPINDVATYNNNQILSWLIELKEYRKEYGGSEDTNTNPQEDKQND